MGRVSSRYAGLSLAQLEGIDALARKLQEQTLAKCVLVTFASGTAIAQVGEPDPTLTLQSFSEKVATRLRVEVRYDESTTLGLVRLRIKQFGEEVEKIVRGAPS
jgi:hypothetical protein